MKLTQRLARRLTAPIAKALYDLHPELLERQPLLRLYSDEEQAGGGGFKEGADYYASNVWVRRAVQVISDNIAPLPLMVKDTKTGEATAEHQLLKLFAHVNDSQDPIDLWQQWATDMLLGGESGFEFVRNGRGDFAEIWIRQPNDFSVRVEKGKGRRYGGILSYCIDDNWGTPFDVPPDEFVHFKFYNPLNPWRGLAPITGVRMGILIDEFARAWSRMFFKNAARPDVAIIAPQGLTKTEREELERKFSGKFSGLENAHRVVALEEGVTDVKPISYPPKDVEWLEQRKFSRQEIAAIFGVPDEVMGFGRDTYENFKTALKALWMLTLIPLTRSRDARLTEFFRGGKLLSPRERIISDLSEVEVLREDKGAKVTMAKELWQMAVPLNDALEYAGVDIGEIPGGDVGYVSIALVPVMGGGRSERLLEVTLPDESKQTKAGVAFGSPEHEKIWQRKIARIEPHEDEFKRALGRALQLQQNEVNRRVRNSLEFGKAKARGVVAGEFVKQNVIGLFDPYAEAEKWRAEFGPLLAEALQAAGLDELLDLGLDIAFDLNRPEVQAEIGNILAQFANKVNDTTYNDLIGVFSQAETEGAGIPQIIEMLSGYWEGRKSAASRERIARTTMTAVNSAGDEAAWGQTEGLVVGSRWLAAIDARTRATHMAAHNQARRRGEMFEVGGAMLAYPGDPSGPPQEIINCRCSRVAILVDEEWPIYPVWS